MMAAANQKLMMPLAESIAAHQDGPRPSETGQPSPSGETNASEDAMEPVTKWPDEPRFGLCNRCRRMASRPETIFTSLPQPQANQIGPP